MKDSIHWKFRPILGGCCTNPSKGTPPLKGYTRCKHVSWGYETAGGVLCCCSVLELPLCMCQDFSFWFSFKGHLLLPKSKSKSFCRRFLKITKSSSTKNSDCSYYLRISCFPSGGRVLFLFFCEIPVFAPNVSIHFGEILKTMHFHLLSVWGWKDFLSLSIIYHQPPETLKYSEIHVCLYKTTMAKLTSPKNVQRPLYRSTLAHDFALMPTNPAKIGNVWTCLESSGKTVAPKKLVLWGDIKIQ